MGIPGSSSDASTSGDARATSDGDVFETVRVPHVHADEEKHHENNKKLKTGTEKMLSLLRCCDEITAFTLSLVHASFTHTFSSPKPYATQLTLIVESILACAGRARMVYLFYIPLTNARSFYSGRSYFISFPTFSFSCCPFLLISLAWTLLSHPHYKL
jgi:hypothetical protein